MYVKIRSKRDRDLQEDRGLIHCSPLHGTAHISRMRVAVFRTRLNSVILRQTIFSRSVAG